MMARSKSVSLIVRQHPQHALVTPEHKEKGRKPIDPPPIVQLLVEDDSQGNWLVNPFLFMNAVLIEADDDEQGSQGQPKNPSANQSIGQIVSSLHRLKDIDNKDGGFFVFGDISCRRLGSYRLQFNLFDYDKSNGHVYFITSTVSQPFQVVSSKEFKGLMESTHLSRTFSDQGVRLRLRKEPRTITGAKRSFDTTPPESNASEVGYNYGGPVHDHQYNYGGNTAFKRQRSESEYSPQNMYSQGQAGSGMVAQYGGVGGGAGGQTWSTHTQQGMAIDPAVAYGTSQTGAANWQRGGMQSSYSGVGSAGMQYYPTSASSSRGGYDYQQPQSVQAYGLTTPTSISDATNTSYLSSYQLPQQQSSSTYGQRSLSAQTSAMGYLAAAAAGGAAGYDPHASRSVKTEPAHASYGTAHNPQDAYGSASQSYASAHAHPDMSLSSGMLNRGFSGAYPGQEHGGSGGAGGSGAGTAYGNVPEHDLGDLSKSHTQAYPTPHHTSPAQQMRENG